VGQQAVTVVLRAMPPLRQLSRGAAQQRDRYAVSVRLAMRRGAISALMDASGALLADMQHLFGLLSAQHSGSGQHGRTHARRIESLTKVRCCPDDTAASLRLTTDLLRCTYASHPTQVS